MKIIIQVAILIFVFNQFSYCQSWSSKAFYHGCSKGELKWDTLHFNNGVIKYHIISKSYDHTDSVNRHFFTGHILVDLEKGKLRNKELKRMFKQLREKLDLLGFTAFNRCEAHLIHISAIGANTEDKKAFLREHTLGGVIF